MILIRVYLSSLSEKSSGSSFAHGITGDEDDILPVRTSLITLARHFTPLLTTKFKEKASFSSLLYGNKPFGTAKRGNKQHSTGKIFIRSAGFVLTDLRIPPDNNVVLEFPLYQFRIGLSELFLSRNTNSYPAEKEEKIDLLLDIPKSIISEGFSKVGLLHLFVFFYFVYFRLGKFKML
jgi:hypothetical protein